jgi:hypothetical protein
MESPKSSDLGLSYFLAHKKHIILLKKANQNDNKIYLTY